jgi:hypothetical protein
LKIRTSWGYSYAGALDVVAQITSYRTAERQPSGRIDPAGDLDGGCSQGIDTQEPEQPALLPPLTERWHALGPR